MKIAALFVAYHPDIEQLLNNVAAVIDSVEYVLVWRNSSVADYSPLASLSDKVILLGDGENRFIAYPLNQALQWCSSHGCDFLLTMDQDSTWSDFTGFRKSVKLNRDDNIAIYAPSVNKCGIKNIVGGVN